MVDKITNSSIQTSKSLTVFFDGSCPICSKEINFYKMRAGADELSWVDVSDEEILVLNKIGVRAVRFNLYRGGSEALDKLESFARRIYDLDRVTSVYCD